METTNYKLALCGDAQGSFIEWRKSINGPDNSNMVKIDAALASKADSSVAVSVVLSASNWIGISAPYVQEIDVVGISASTNGSISLAQSANYEQREAARNALLSVSEQNDNKITVVADGEIPTVDIPAVIIILG